jgi:Ca2+/Na+ antiporter
VLAGRLIDLLDIDHFRIDVVLVVLVVLVAPAFLLLFLLLALLALLALLLMLLLLLLLLFFSWFFAISCQLICIHACVCVFLPDVQDSMRTCPLLWYTLGNKEVCVCVLGNTSKAVFWLSMSAYLSEASRTFLITERVLRCASWRIQGGVRAPHFLQRRTPKEVLFTAADAAVVATVVVVLVRVLVFVLALVLVVAVVAAIVLVHARSPVCNVFAWLLLMCFNNNNTVNNNSPPYQSCNNKQQRL